MNNQEILYKVDPLIYELVPPPKNGICYGSDDMPTRSEWLEMREKIKEYCSHRDREDLKVFKISQDETIELTYAEAIEYDKECTWEDEGIAVAYTPLQAEYLGLLYERYIEFGDVAIAPHYDDKILAISIEHI